MKAADDLKAKMYNTDPNSLHKEVGQEANNAPSIILFKNNYVIGWAGRHDDHQLYLMQSTSLDNWPNEKIPLKKYSPTGVCLTVFNNEFYLTWSTKDNNIIVKSFKDTSNPGPSIVIPEIKSPYRPTLAVHNGQLVMGWTDMDSRLNVIFSDDGINWKDKQTLPEFSIDAPYLASFQNALFIAWTNVDKHQHLSVCRRVDSEKKWTDKVILSETSVAGPGMATDGLYLYLIYAERSDKNNNEMKLLRSPDGILFPLYSDLKELSSYSPSIIINDRDPDKVFAVECWTGESDKHELYTKITLIL